MFGLMGRRRRDEDSTKKSRSMNLTTVCRMADSIDSATYSLP